MPVNYENSLPMQSSTTQQAYPYQSNGYTDSYSSRFSRQSFNTAQPMRCQNLPQQNQQPASQAVYALAVKSKEDAANAPFQLDGSVTYFLDRANKMVYSKQFNLNDGSVIFHEYYEDSLVNGQNAQQPKQEAQEQAKPVEQAKSVSYVEKREFEALQSRIKELEEKLQSISGQEAQKKVRGEK